MPKFQVRTTQASFVTWTYVIEADSENAAMEKFWEGDHEEAVATEIEDSVDGYDPVDVVSKLEDDNDNDKDKDNPTQAT